jgi:hypothetical protein
LPKPSAWIAAAVANSLRVKANDCKLVDVRLGGLASFVALSRLS